MASTESKKQALCEWRQCRGHHRHTWLQHWLGWMRA